MSEDRGQNQYETKDIGVMVDHISNLPDCILHHILSFMPTKEVVKTSMLSTRWKNLWASVPNIDIDDRVLCASEVDGMRPADVTSFINFVERVLRLRDASNINKFRLICRVFGDASQIRSWISDAIMHNVQELALSLYADDVICADDVIPRSMFDSSTSLVSLKINMDCAIQLPYHVSFPCLKTLHLLFVEIPNDDFTEKLFSGCPVLEELVLFQCEWMHLKNIAISSSTLKSLTIWEVSVYETISDPFSRIKIDAANLTDFEYYGFLSNEILLNNTPSLDKAFISISNRREDSNKVACLANYLLKQLHYVVSLRVSNETMEFLLFAGLDNIRFPVFENMTHFMVTWEIHMSDTFGVLMGLLSFCPVLQSICFSEGFKQGLHLGDNNPIWSSIPTCISNSLKTVSFKDFHGYKSEMFFLKHILKTAYVLETMDIRWSEKYLQHLKKKTKVRMELEKIEKKAADCVIKLS